MADQNLKQRYDRTTLLPRRNLKTFTARIVERLTHDGHPAVVLDRTAFYPTGGGQPNDRGKLGHALVVDVIERDTDSAVLHVLDFPQMPEPSGRLATRWPASWIGRAALT